MSTTTSEAHTRPVFALFEGYAISSVVASLEMVGLLSQLEDGALSAATVAAQGGETATLLTASLRYLATRGLVTERDGVFALTDYGAEVYRDVGHLVWLVGGYGEPLRRVDAFLGGAKRYGTDFTRDGRWVADGSAVIGKTDVVPDAMSLLERHEFGTVLDLGCGNARFLANVCRTFGARGIGVDLTPAACVEAEKVIGELGLRDQVRVEVGDAGVFSGFAAPTRRAGERFGVDPRDILMELGRRRVVAGQEDIIVEVAIALAEAREPDLRLEVAG